MKLLEEYAAIADERQLPQIRSRELLFSKPLERGIMGKVAHRRRSLSSQFDVYNSITYKVLIFLG